MTTNTPSYDFYEEERSKGVRFNYNTLPVTRSEEAQTIVPIGVVFSPLDSVPDRVIADRLVKRCSKCDGCFNKYCRIDQAAGVWTCCLCGVRNSGITADLLGLANGDNLEYVIPLEYSKSKRFRDHGNGMVFLYCIDLNTEHDDLESLKETLINDLDLLPVGSHIGLITYDSNVYIHENTRLGQLQKITALRGDKEYKEVNVLLGLNEYQTEVILKKYFHPLYHEDSKSSYIRLIRAIRSSHLHNNPSKSTTTEGSLRPKRAQGSALSISIQLLRLLKLHGHLFNFVSGPGTVGKGQITSIEKTEKIRSFNDIGKGKTKYFDESTKFYQDLITPEDANLSVHFFIASYDQVGIYEMKNLSMKTGGVIVLNDSFSMNLFKMNFRKIFQRVDDQTDLIDFNSNCELKVVTSNSLQVAGFVGDGTVVKSVIEDSTISDVEVGNGLGRVLRVGYLSRNHNFNIFFKVNTVGYSSEKQAVSPNVYVQFQTKYFNSNGEEALRIITVERTTTNKQSYKIEDNFDQEACIVLITKQLIHQLLTQKIQFRQIEQLLSDYLLKFMKHFGIFIKNEPSSFKPFSNFEQLPNFFYNLIYKSPVISNFNNTPDEFTYLVSNFNKISTNDSLLMIQPILLSFSLNTEEPIPIPLDLNFFKDDEIILMDSFTHVLIHFGTTIAQWRDSELDPEEYSNIYEFIEEPKQEAMEILKERFPLSRYIITDDGDSQDRFLKSKLNSGMEHMSDDVSLGKFYREIVKKVCLE